MWQIKNSFISRINKYFESRGGEGNFTKIFCNFPYQTQAEILTLLGVSTEEEKPLIASYKRVIIAYCLQHISYGGPISTIILYLLTWKTLLRQEHKLNT
ncbi:hypothetical protein [Pseudobacteroides cellulosolvens]|uniref:Uncharacterized protein n=1 Tax=Pseudobacteroides cellulosolvens ATCC 35603 = DSM 2933 TaxID=398512 RepID=A0A0L6JJ76_9FIRM|nr:hypothetical protein [Pseudobacteroides cellulosolvens]KNY25492.1 hypothetical protein Bccel_0752 [Pseudobacteroides cellulosolvens ATCC 35603 = DSM 2933]